MQKLIFALALGRAAAQTTAPSYAPTEAESVAPSYAPTDTVYPYDPSATPTGGFPSATPTAKPTTPAPSTETGAPSATPAPTATKAQVVVIRQTTAGLTLAGCLASKDAFQATFAAQLGVATRLIVVVCEEITITRRRLTTGDTIEVVIEYKCGPDNTAVCNTVFETAGDLTPDSINAELQAQIAANPALDPTGELVTVTVQDIISVEEIPQEDFTDTDSPISSPTMAPTADPTSKPTSQPTAVPAAGPTAKPTFMPTMTPTSAPFTRRRALTEEETSGPASRKLLFAAAVYGSEVVQVLKDIWHA